jgi:hypothetical protein
MGSLIVLVLAAAIAWSWLEAWRAREQAVQFGHVLCRKAGLQLLDQSVALRRLRVQLGRGRPCLRRRYAFEVSTDGSDRHHAHLDLAGRELADWSLPLAGTGPDPALLPSGQLPPAT